MEEKTQFNKSVDARSVFDKQRDRKRKMILDEKQAWEAHEKQNETQKIYSKKQKYSKKQRDTPSEEHELKSNFKVNCAVYNAINCWVLLSITLMYSYELVHKLFSYFLFHCIYFYGYVRRFVLPFSATVFVLQETSKLLKTSSINLLRKKPTFLRFAVGNMRAK